MQSMGCMLAAAAYLPLARADAAEPEAGSASPVPVTDGKIMEKLSTYMSEAGDRALPAEVIEKAKHHILDTIAAMVSGVDLPPAKVALKYARENASESGGTVVGSSVLCRPSQAAFVNGMQAHSDETDDSHAPSFTHPGCSMIATALAAGEHYGISGTRFLRAVTLGYDIGTRMPMALGGLPFEMKTHHSTHSIGANFGSAAIAGCAAGFSAQQMRWVIDYAAQQAAGSAAWMRDLEHVSKSLLFAGRPARNAIDSALLITLGATGVDDILSGPDNFFITMTPKADPAKLVAELGERFEITRTNIKKWTVGSPIQAPLDAIQNIMQRHPFGPDDVQKIVVRVATSEEKTVNNRAIPSICMQHLVALFVVKKTVSFDSAHDLGLMTDPAVLKVRAKVQMTPDVELERLYPQRQGIVAVTLSDGSTLTERVTAVRGTAENPMTRAEIVTKATDLMAPRLGATKCDRLVESILNIETIENVRTLRPFLQRA